MKKCFAKQGDRFRAGSLAWLVAVWLMSSQSWAVIETYQFGDENQHQRYQTFINELRCPKCQNQNLAGSNSPIAEDLRRELHRMIVSGKGNDEIVDFMVSRYGDFILYRPPLDKNTWLLWSAPVLLLLLGLVVVAIFVARQRRNQLGAGLDQSRLAADEQCKLDALLAQYPE